MLKIKFFLAITLFALLVTACKTNNGDIGPWYGNWAMTAMTVDGKEYTAWAEGGNETVWSFQNNIICIQDVTPLHDIQRRWGTWTDDGKTLTLDYRQHDTAEPDPAHSYKYTAPEWLLMEANTVTVLSIDKLIDNTAVLSTTNAAGQHIIYTLKKNY